MNAQQILDSVQTFGDFSVFFKSPKTTSSGNMTRGDKFVARKENTQYPQVCEKVSLTSFHDEVSEGKLSSTFHNSLMPRTDLLSQININNCKNTAIAKADVLKSMGIELLW